MHKLIAVAALTLTACQGRGLQPPAQSVTTPTTNPTPATTTSAPEVAPEHPSTTATTAETIPETVPTTQRATPRTTLAYVAPVAATGACGGPLPPCWVMRAESGGDPQAYNPSGCYDNNRESPGYGTRGCFGKWQFMRATWWGLGYSGVATDHSEAVQDAAAAKLWAGGRGCSHWNAC